MRTIPYENYLALKNLNEITEKQLSKVLKENEELRLKLEKIKDFEFFKFFFK